MTRRFLFVVFIAGLIGVSVWMTKRTMAHIQVPPPVQIVPPIVAPTPVPPPEAHPEKMPDRTIEPPVPAHKPKAPHKSPPAKSALPLIPAPLPMPPAVIAPPATLDWKGNTDTSITHPGQIVILNDRQWIHFWSEHHPDEAAPDVDFANKMVVGVFVGRRPADAFSVDITDVRTVADALVVDYIERAPPPGTFQVAVEVYPYEIKVVPHSTLHVKFNQLSAQYKPSPYQRPPAVSTATAVPAK